jgi:predicted metalloprotease with PDZ domain
MNNPLRTAVVCGAVAAALVVAVPAGAGAQVPAGGAAAGAGAGPAGPGAPTRPMQVAVDATDVHRGVFHTREVIPAAAGTLALAYPEWVQGEHAPSGPLTQVAGFVVTAGGRTLPWRRDVRQPFVVRVTVPPGAEEVEVSLDYLSPPAEFGSGYGESPNMTPHLEIVDWHDLLVYPLGEAIDQMPVRASVRLPAGWQFDTSLHAVDPAAATAATAATAAGATDAAGGVAASMVAFQETSLYTLIDSPVLAGDLFRTIEVAPGGVGRAPVRLSVAADRAAALAVPEARIQAYRRLPPEAEALFGAPHYLEYHWLVALGDSLSQDGLEHHQSSDDRGRLGMFTDPSLLLGWGHLLPHEYVHSWNGKYRRPAGLAVRDAQQPLETELLWVYEGLTRYLGDLVLTTRSGVRSFEESREYLAYVAAIQDRARPGRRWRPLVDTAVALPAFAEAPAAWTAWRRPRDYYEESMLIWLEVDTILRRQSGGARSLDDFCKAFLGGAAAAPTPPTVQPYTADDVFAALDRVAHYDWRDFFDRRVEQLNPHAPLGGIANGGWRLVYDERPNLIQSARARNFEIVDAGLSMGLWLKQDGTVTDVVVGSAAWDAGFGPGMKVMAVNRQKWLPESLPDALAAAVHASEPIEITVAEGDTIRTLQVDYHAGDLHPHLERDPAQPDLLQAILAPHAR